LRAFTIAVKRKLFFGLAQQKAPVDPVTRSTQAPNPAVKSSTAQAQARPPHVA